MGNSRQHIRFHRLEQVCSKALTESQKVLTDDNLHACYPTLASSQDGRALIQTIKQQLTESWQANTQNEFTSIFSEREIEEKLNELDELIAIAQDRKDSEGQASQIPIDQLTPINIVSSHLIPLKETNLEALHSQLDTLKSNNIRLLNELQEQATLATQLRSSTMEIMERISKIEQVSQGADIESKLRTLVHQLGTDV